MKDGGYERSLFEMMCVVLCVSLSYLLYMMLCVSLLIILCVVLCVNLLEMLCVSPSELLCVNLSKMLCETLCVSTLHIFEILKISFRGHATITLTTLWMGGYSNVYTSK